MKHILKSVIALSVAFSAAAPSVAAREIYPENRVIFIELNNGEKHQYSPWQEVKYGIKSITFREADYVTDHGVYFGAYADTSELDFINESNYLTLKRVNANDELTTAIEVKFTDADGNPLTDADGQSLVVPFTVPNQVTFAKGELTANLNISLDVANAIPNKPYYVTLTIKSLEAEPRELSRARFSLVYTPWSEWERIGGYDDYATVTLNAFGINGRKVPVFVSHSLLGAGTRYCFGGVGMPGYEDVEEGSSDWYNISYVNGNHFIVSVPCNLPEGVDYPSEECYAFMPPAETGDSESFGSMLKVCDIYTFRHTINNSYMSQYPESALYSQSRFYPETGTFNIYATYYYGTDTAYASIREYMRLPGFFTFGVEMEYIGDIANEDAGAYEPCVMFTPTDDTTAFYYRLVKGNLTTSEIDEVAAEMKADESREYLFGNQKLTFPIKESGTYTVVAISTDARAIAKNVSHITFDYEYKTYVNPWTTIGTAMFTDGILYGSYKLTDGSYLGGDQYTVTVQQDKENKNHYRLLNPYEYYSGQEITKEGIYGISFWIGETTPYVIIEQSEIGIEDPYGDGSTFCVSANVGSLLGEYTVDQLSTMGFSNGNKCANYMGVIDETGLITFPACTVVQTWSSLMNGEDATWYYSNYNEAALEASSNKTLNATSIYNHEYGNGLLQIDLSGLDINNPAANTTTEAAAMSANAPLKLQKADDQQALKAAKGYQFLRNDPAVSHMTRLSKGVKIAQKAGNQIKVAEQLTLNGDKAKAAGNVRKGYRGVAIDSETLLKSRISQRTVKIREK